MYCPTQIVHGQLPGRLHDWGSVERGALGSGDRKGLVLGVEGVPWSSRIDRLSFDCDPLEHSAVDTGRHQRIA